MSNISCLRTIGIFLAAIILERTTPQGVIQLDFSLREVQGGSENLEFAQMQGAKKISQRRISFDMQARHFFRNTAVGMKCGFLEVP